ncbi:MAG: helix-turn-helix domain-containing protein [Solirubrobacteraceae bacterium]
MAEIGSTLREARMRAHIDISEVEARTKIRAKYLRAIENEEFDLLPGAVYVKSFLRTYGDFLGLDSRLLLDEFKRRYERPDDYELRPLSGTGRERERGRRNARGGALRRRSRSPVVVICVAVVVIIVGLILIGSHQKGGPNAANNPVTPAGGGHHSGTDGHHRGNSAGHHKAGTHSGKLHKAGPTGTGTGTGTTTVTTASLTIKPTGPVWVCVANPSGKLLLPGQTFNAGESVPPQSAPELLVVLGNTNADLTVDGRVYPLQASVHSIPLEITPQGAKPIASVPACG